jgi:hypothetical protein
LMLSISGAGSSFGADTDSNAATLSKLKTLNPISNIITAPACRSQFMRRRRLSTNPLSMEPTMLIGLSDISSAPAVSCEA